MIKTVVGVLVLFLIGYMLIVFMDHFQKFLVSGQSSVNGPYTTLSNQYAQ